MSCANSTAIETYSSREMHVNYFFNQPASSLNNKTYFECVVYCVIENNRCAVSVSMDKRCEWYLSSASYSYGSAIAVGKKQRTTMQLCPTGIARFL